jgi:hypothetical protein
LSGALLTGLVQSVPDLSGIQQFCFQNLITSSLLVTSCPFFVSNLYFISLISGWILIRRSGSRTSKMWLGPPSARSDKALVTRGPPPHLRHHPSHSNDEDEEEHELYKIHSPIECTNRMPQKYSKRTPQGTINRLHGEPVYECLQQSSDPRFWSHFHTDWYSSI